MKTTQTINSRGYQKQIPEYGLLWSDQGLMQLGNSVKAVYPELIEWIPYLAAEAWLFFLESNGLPYLQGQAPVYRNEIFLKLLRDRQPDEPRPLR